MKILKTALKVIGYVFITKLKSFNFNVIEFEELQEIDETENESVMDGVSNGSDMNVSGETDDICSVDDSVPSMCDDQEETLQEAESSFDSSTTSSIETTALLQLGDIDDVGIDYRPVDVDEEKVISMFFENGCGCRKWKGKNCIHQFSVKYIQDIRSQCFQLSRQELDMLLFGQLLANADKTEITCTEWRHSPHVRSRMSCSYRHQGKSICLRTLLFIHTTGIKRFKNISSSFQMDGILPRIHGNTKRLPWNSLSLSSIRYVISFLVNYTEENGLLLPGRIPGYTSTDLKLLPSSKSKRAIWKTYEMAANSSEGIQVVAYSTFCQLWQKLLPSIIIMRPMTDLCWQCQQNSTTILRSAHASDLEKSATLSKAIEHLRIVTVERSYYRSISEDCRRSIRSHFSEGGNFQPPPLSSMIPANSKDIKAHYSFDYAQMVSQ